MNELSIILCAKDEALAKEFDFISSCLMGVSAYRGEILDCRVDAVVSPGNSFGFMDGGIDEHFAKAFPVVQERVQKAIKEKFCGELLVGQALVVRTEDHRAPKLIYAPTMRVPMILSETVNPYLAARAALAVAREHGMRSIAFPGLGTGVGRVSPWACATQIMAAIQGLVFPASWYAAQTSHQMLYSNSARDLQNIA